MINILPSKVDNKLIKGEPVRLTDEYNGLLIRLRVLQLFHSCKQGPVRLETKISVTFLDRHYL